MSSAERNVTEIEKRTILNLLGRERLFVNLLFSSMLLIMLLTGIKIIYDLLGVFDVTSSNPREATLIAMILAFFISGLFVWMFYGEAGRRTWTMASVSWQQGQFSWKPSRRSFPLYYLDGKRMVAPFAWKLHEKYKDGDKINVELAAVVETSKQAERQLSFALAITTQEGKTLRWPETGSKT